MLGLTESNEREYTKDNFYLKTLFTVSQKMFDDCEGVPFYFSRNHSPIEKMQR